MRIHPLPLSYFLAALALFLSYHSSPSFSSIYSANPLILEGLRELLGEIYAPRSFSQLD
jgi:hypothetical protein